MPRYLDINIPRIAVLPAVPLHYDCRKIQIRCPLEQPIEIRVKIPTRKKYVSKCSAMFKSSFKRQAREMLVKSFFGLNTSRGGTAPRKRISSNDASGTATRDYGMLTCISLKIYISLLVTVVRDNNKVTKDTVAPA